MFRDYISIIKMIFMKWVTCISPLPTMTVGGVISINAFSPAKEVAILPASMLPNSAA
ncbi:hypothetical protein [Peribacillus simplex]|uniref:hypothetical protein n=1 Tax=Peribacillus simplex TaxID=1478 RepID=UPI001F4FE130|nr:hypothetical protein [Peribacillus simplex]